MGNILSELSYILMLSWVFLRNNSRSQNINLASVCASEIVLSNSSFDSKIDADGDATLYGYSSLSPLTVDQTLKGSDLSGQ